MQRRCLAAGLIALVLFAGCGRREVEPTAPPAVDTLKVVLLPFLSFAPILIAEEEGYFTEQDLKIEFVRMPDASQVMPALFAGELDVWCSSVTAGLINAIGRGGKIRIVADKGRMPRGEPGYTSIVVRSDLARDRRLEAAGLRGMTIACKPMSFRAYYLRKLLDASGLTTDDVQLVNPPDASLSEAMKNGAVDAAIIGEPWVTRVIETTGAVIWDTLKESGPYQVAVVVYGPNLLDNPALGDRFMAAYLKGLRDFSQGKTDRNVEILAKHTGLDPDLLRKATWPAMREDGRIDVDSVLDYQAWAIEGGLMDKVVPAEEFWDPGYVERAAAMLPPDS